MENSPEILLLPGMHGTDVLFEPLIAALNGRVTTRTVDYPLNEPLDYKRLLHLVTDCFPMEKRVFILGESFSGPLAVLAAAEKPQSIAGIILVATFVKSPMPGWMGRVRGLLRGPVMSLRPRKMLIQWGLGPGCSKSVRNWVLEKLPRLKGEIIAARIRAILEVNVREELKRLKVPVLYIGGSKDRVVKRSCLEDVWICRPDMQIKVFNTGHAVLQCKPEEAAEAIVEFVGGKSRETGDEG